MTRRHDDNIVNAKDVRGLTPYVNNILAEGNYLREDTWIEMDDIKTKWNDPETVSVYLCTHLPSEGQDYYSSVLLSTWDLKNLDGFFIALGQCAQNSRNYNDAGGDGYYRMGYSPEAGACGTNNNAENVFPGCTAMLLNWWWD